MTKAKLTIEPGCEAWSNLCGECGKLDRRNGGCLEFVAQVTYNIIGNFGVPFRLKACLDAEVTE